MEVLFVLVIEEEFDIFLALCYNLDLHLLCWNHMRIFKLLLKLDLQLSLEAA